MLAYVVQQIIPGPPLYQGKRDPPTGAPAVVAAPDTGAFPPGIDEKYQKFKKDADAWATGAHTFFNNLDALRQFPNDLISGAGVASTISSLSNSWSFFQKHLTELGELTKRQNEIKLDLVKAGYLAA